MIHYARFIGLVEMLEMLVYPRVLGFGHSHFTGWGRDALLPKAGDGIEVALPVPHLTFALRQPVEFIHVAVGWGPQVGAVAEL